MRATMALVLPPHARPRGSGAQAGMQGHQGGRVARLRGSHPVPILWSFAALRRSARAAWLCSAPGAAIRQVRSSSQAAAWAPSSTFWCRSARPPLRLQAREQLSFDQIGGRTGPAVEHSWTARAQERLAPQRPSLNASEPHLVNNSLAALGQAAQHPRSGSGAAASSKADRRHGNQLAVARSSIADRRPRADRRLVPARVGRAVPDGGC